MIGFLCGVYAGLRDSLRFNPEGRLSLSLIPARIALMTISVMAIAHVGAWRAMAVIGGAFVVWWIIESGMLIVGPNRTPPLQDATCDNWHSYCFSATVHSFVVLQEKCIVPGCTWNKCSSRTILKINHVTIADGPWLKIREDGSVVRFLIEARPDGSTAESICRTLDEFAGIEP